MECAIFQSGIDFVLVDSLREGKPLAVLTDFELDQRVGLIGPFPGFDIAGTGEHPRRARVLF